ncbi:hypothetical protein [Nocardioides abyssi]|uniref:Uncharacterized protein n=1 Tax=Nocardioides abyssi TaxID=3058370 RepID=A0ABT8ESI9_9ACTN|nr:hypothetical protein [Nocardioides abyssi]MDN4161084.1 hypothetical protein [Nocardioides abyssi]
MAGRSGRLRRRERDQSLCEQVVKAAVAYRDTGMPIDEAFPWNIRWVSAKCAVYNRQRGWNPDAYSTLVALCAAQMRRWPDHSRPDEDAWVESSIPAWRTIRYLKAGLTLAESIEQEERRAAGDDVDGAIDTLIGLRQPDA